MHVKSSGANWLSFISQFQIDGITTRPQRILIELFTHAENKNASFSQAEFEKGEV